MVTGSGRGERFGLDVTFQGDDGDIVGPWGSLDELLDRSVNRPHGGGDAIGAKCSLDDLVEPIFLIHLTGCILGFHNTDGIDDEAIAGLEIDRNRFVRGVWSDYRRDSEGKSVDFDRKHELRASTYLVGMAVAGVCDLGFSGGRIQHGDTAGEKRCFINLIVQSSGQSIQNIARVGSITAFIS